MTLGAICPKSVHFPPRSSRMEEASPRGVYAASCNGLDRGSQVYSQLSFSCVAPKADLEVPIPKYFELERSSTLKEREHVL